MARITTVAKKTFNSIRSTSDTHHRKTAMVVGVEADTHPTILVSLRVEWRRLEPERLASCSICPFFFSPAPRCGASRGCGDDDLRWWRIF
jgi:hypothetical protein